MVDYWKYKRPVPKMDSSAIGMDNKPYDEEKSQTKRVNTNKLAKNFKNNWNSIAGG